MLLALNLDQRDDRARHDEDGHLDVDWNGTTHRLLFELKSTVKGGDYGTGRDTGLRQYLRWADMQFVFGIFEAKGDRPSEMWHGSPRQMRSWNSLEQAYLQPDVDIQTLVPRLIDGSVLDAVLGPKTEYSYADLQRLLKDQWNASRAADRPNLYDERADLNRGRAKADNRYSRVVALQAVRERVAYLLARGGTVNNRKISAGYVRTHCTLLQRPWAASLSRAVEAELAEEPPANPL